MSFGASDILQIGGIALAFATGNIPLGVALTGNYLLSKLPRSGTLERGQQGITANVTSNEAAIPVIYGQTKIGLTAMIDIRQQPTDEKVLSYIGALCLGGEDGGGIEEVSKVYFDDKLAIDGATAGDATQTNMETPWSTFGGSTFGTDLWCQYGLSLGADAATHMPELVTRYPASWSATDDGRGIAYLALLLYYNDEVWVTGWPKVTALVKGVKCFDPRDSSTTWAASQNPACAIWDFMTSVKYGMAVPVANLNTASFISAANACDVLVSIPGATTQKRFTCNGWLNPAASPQTNLARLLSSCRGEIVRIGAEYHLQVRLTQAAESFTLDTTNIQGSFQFWRGGINEVPNSMTATYVDPVLNYQPNDVSWPEAGAANAYLTADNDFANNQQTELPFTDDLYRAEQVAQVLLQEARADVGVSLIADRTALVLQQGDVVKVTHPTPGWTDYEVWIVAMGILPDGNVHIIGRQYDAAAYTLTAVSTADTPPGTNLPDPFTVDPPTNLVLLADGTTSQVLQDSSRVPRIKVTWTASTDAFLSSYRVRMKVTAEADSTFEIVATPLAGETQVFISNVANGVEYTVEILAVNSNGVTSAWVSDTVTVTTTESPAVAAITATLNGATIQVTWSGGNVGSISYVDKATEPSLADTQAGADTAVSPVTAYTFAAGAELRWVGVLPYTDAASTDNEGALVTFQIQYNGAGGTLTEGDIRYADATPELVSLPIGTPTHALVVNAGGTAPEWAAVDLTGPTLTLTHATLPTAYWIETGGTVNNTTWRILANADAFQMATVADDLLSAVNWLRVERTLNVVDSITLTASTVTIGGGNALTGSGAWSSGSMAVGTNPATDGVLRIPNNLAINARNAANNANIALIYLSAADVVTFGTVIAATGGIDGVVGGVTPAAGSFTTVTTSGIISVDDVTDTTSTTTGSIHTDGGVGIAKDIWVGASLNVAGVGPHAIGAAAVDYTQTKFGGTFVSGGAANFAIGTSYQTDLESAAGDSSFVALCYYAGSVKLGATIPTDVTATLRIDEPLIDLNGFTTATAATVHISGAPTEGSAGNFALLIDLGAVSIPTPNTVAGTGLMVTNNAAGTQEIMRDSSSARFKENIAEALIDPAKVLSINAKEFGRNDQDGRFMGFIVEDFHAAGFTNILAYDGEGPVGFLEYGRGITALQQVVLQDHDSRIKALESLRTQPTGATE